MSKKTKGRELTTVETIGICFVAPFAALGVVALAAGPAAALGLASVVVKGTMLVKVLTDDKK